MNEGKIKKREMGKRKVKGREEAKEEDGRGRGKVGKGT